MGIIRQSKVSANTFWTDIIYHNHETGSSLNGPKFIWDARVESSLTLDDTVVTEWRDINQGKVLNQNFGSDVSKAPTYLLDNLGGQPAINFNGVNNYLGTFELGEESVNFTMIIVCGNLAVNLAEDFGTIFNAFFDGNQIQLLFNHVDSYVQLQGILFNLQKTFLPLQALAFRVTGGNLVEFWSNGGESGNSEIQPLGSGLDFLTIGAVPPDNCLDGSIAWMGYYDSAISDDDLDLAFSYLSGVYGMSVTPIIS